MVLIRLSALHTHAHTHTHTYTNTHLVLPIFGLWHSPGSDWFDTLARLSARAMRVVIKWTFAGRWVDSAWVTAGLITAKKKVGSARPSRIEARVYEFNKGEINLDLLSRLVYLFKKGERVRKKEREKAERGKREGG